MQHETDGFVAGGFERVGVAFRDLFDRFGEVGAAVAVHAGEETLVDLWGGTADVRSGAVWEEDTLVLTYSTTKPFAAICLLQLVDRGLVGLDAPVADIWPEFGHANKEALPVRWLLTHQSGLIALREPQAAEAILDWDRMVALLAAEEPWWEPGTRIGEQAYFFGHLVGEIVRRVTGRSLGSYLEEEIARPLGIDFHIGLSEEEQSRAAYVTGMTKDWRRAMVGRDGSLAARALLNPPGLLSEEVVNGPAWRAAEIPAANGHGTARGIARFYAGLARNGMIGGRRVLGEDLLREMVSEQCSGVDAVYEEEISYGLGVWVDTVSFGMGGLGGSMGFGSLAHGYGFGYVTNKMADHARADHLERAVQECFARLRARG